jgi:hypothetical protein
MKLADHITLPPETVAHTIGILAQKGAGKTYAAMKLTELMLEAKAQVACLDPTGVWWGLKADGDGPGFPILVMGGSHGDIPLAPTSGAVVADFLVQSGHSVVLDMSAFDSNAEQVRFVTDFSERLFRAKSDARTPLHLMLDEADSFAPQRPMPGEQRMLGALEAIVRRGRSRGLGMTMISQRPACLNKNVLTQIDLLIALRVVGKQDHKALGDWTAINGTKEEQDKFLAALPSLQTGHAFFWSPSWLGCFTQGRILKRRTFDSSQTPAPGSKPKTPKVAPVDIVKLSAEILATVESAKANDPQELKREIARLEKDKPAPVEKIVEVPVLSDGEKKMLITLHDTLPSLSHILSQASNSLAVIHRHVTAKNPPPEHYRGMLKPTPTTVPARPAPKAAPATTSSNGALSASQMRVLTSLYWLRNEDTSPEKVAFFANYTVNGTFNNIMGALRSAGYVSGWRLTVEGEAQIPSNVELKPTGAELREWMRSKLSGGENRILDALIEARRRVTTEELADLSNYTVNGTFNNAVGHMRTIGVAEGYAKDGGVKAADVFFE